MNEMYPGPRIPLLILSRGGNLDGSQRQLLYLVSGLDRQCFSPIVILDGEGALNDALRAANIETMICSMSPWRSFSSALKRYHDAYQLLALARARGIRLVHANDAWRMSYADFIARRLAIPRVVHVRGPLLPRDIRKHRLRIADAVIAIAKRYQEDLIAAGIDSERIVLIDDAVDLTRFIPAQTDRSFIRDVAPNGLLLVGLVARITPFKRVHAFLEMIGRLPGDIADSVCFLVVGDWCEPSYRKVVEDTVSRLRLESRVHFLGRCRSEDMPRLLASLDLLVTFSGGSIMFEAMACGTPVLSVRSDSRHSEHTRHNETAWCVSSEDPAVAASALTHLLVDGPLRHRLAAAGRAWAEQHLSVERMIGRTQALYKRLTGLSRH
jgi:glycosyltransferase involved in cell wall biosynthesis